MVLGVVVVGGEQHTLAVLESRRRRVVSAVNAMEHVAIGIETVIRGQMTAGVVVVGGEQHAVTVLASRGRGIVGVVAALVDVAVWIGDREIDRLRQRRAGWRRTGLEVARTVISRADG